MCNYQDEIKYCEDVYYPSQDKVQPIKKESDYCWQGAFTNSVLARKLRTEGIKRERRE